MPSMKEASYGNSGNSHLDQLLEEYLRVINDKDKEVHQLLRQLEELRASVKGREDQWREKVKVLEHSQGDSRERIAELQSKHAEQERATAAAAKEADSVKRQLKEARDTLEDVREGKERAEAAKLEAQEELGTALEQLRTAQSKASAMDSTVAHQEGLLQRQATALSELQSALDATEAAVRGREEDLTRMRDTMRSMMPVEKHEQLLAQIEAKLTEANSALECELAATVAKLQEGEQQLKAARQTINTASQEAEEANRSAAACQREMEQMRQQLSQEKLRVGHREENLQRALDQLKKAAQQNSEERLDLERDVQRTNAQLLRATEELQSASQQHERVRANVEKAAEAARSQCTMLEEKLRMTEEELDRLQRLVAGKERTLADCQDALSRLREESTRAQSELREKLAVATSAAAAERRECDRVQLEMKHVQTLMEQAQQQAGAEERLITAKVEEIQAALQRVQNQLRDKEEENRRLELLHGKEMQKVQHDHNISTEATKRRHETELAELNARMDRYRAELGEQTGDSRGLGKELDRNAEVRRELRAEIDRLQSAVAARDDAVASAKREVERLQGQLTQLEQRLRGRDQEEVALRQRAEAAERATEDAKCHARRSEDASTYKAKTIDSLNETIGRLEEQLRAKDSTLQQTRKEVETALQGEQETKKILLQENAKKERLAVSLAEVEERLHRREIEVSAAEQTYKRVALDASAAAEELKRAQVVAKEREDECLRLSRHAAEVEKLAKQTADQLRAAIQERDDTIADLRRDQAKVLPHLNEERSKVLVLQEKLQHQTELERMHVETLQQRLRELEEGVAARDAELAALGAKKADLEQQVSAFASRAAEAEQILTQRESKFQLRKQELARALEQMEQVKVDADAASKHVEAEVAAADLIRDRYKKEKAKMEAMTAELETKLKQALKSVKMSQQREEELTDRVEELEAALKATQNSFDGRVAEVKAHYKQLAQQQEDAVRGATNSSLDAEQRIAQLQTLVHEARRDALNAQVSHKELERKLASFQALALEDYAEEVVDMKRMYSEMVLRAQRTFVARAMDSMKDGWAAVHHSSASTNLQVQELESRLARLAADHRFALQEAEEAGRRKLDMTVIAHQEELARLHKELADAEKRIAVHRETVSRDGDAKSKQIVELQDTLAQVRAAAERDARQVSVLQGELETARRLTADQKRNLDEEHRKIQRERERLQRKQEDQTAEQRHSEDELRELRSEVRALQEVMRDKERQQRQESDARRTLGEKLAAAEAARETLKVTVADLEKQLNFLKGQLDTARSSHQRALDDNSVVRKSHDSRLEAAQAELSSAVAARRQYERDAANQEERIKELTREVQLLRRQEADMTGQLQARKSEVSALQERCANLESLKNICEASLAETQLREKDLMSKIEELRNAQQLMQLCFDKQQEQLEVGRRLRQQHDLRGHSI